MLETNFIDTEIGSVPKDWSVVTLGEIGRFSKGKGISRTESNTGIIPAVRYGEIYTTHNDYIKSFTSHISEEIAKSSRKLTYGDILFTASGETKEDIGKAVAFVIKDCAAYAGGDIIIFSSLIDNEPIFLGFLLNTKIVVEQRASKAQGDAVVHITTDSIKSLKLPLPPLPEQRRIASALTSIDGLISALDNLIRKKQAIKIGTMQELLSGKRRLEGFREPWREKRLGNCAEVKNGYAFKSSTYSDCGIFKIVTIANVQNGYLATDEFNTVLEKPGDLQSHQDLKKGDILISMTGNVGRVCRVSLNNCLLNQRVGVFKIFGEIDVNFLFIALNTPMFEKEMIGKGHGAAQPNIGKKDIEDYVFLLPSDISEQCAIASVLTAMDDELAALEAKKAKYVALKQGMMQQLLTGKIRLTEETVE